MILPSASLAKMRAEASYSVALLARQAGESEEYVNSARIYAKLADGKVSEAYDYVMKSDVSDVELFHAVEQDC